jgi:uncharacterized protein (TIGR04141 family)
MPIPRTISETRTLYRLESAAKNIDDILTLLDTPKLDELGADIEVLALGDGVPAVCIVAEWPVLKASWCEDLAITTRRPVEATRQESGALLVFALDADVYVLVYGEGHRLVPANVKDQRFGLRFVARTIDPERVNTFTRRSPGMGGRTDITHIAAGAPWWMLSMHAELQVVRQLGGRVGGSFRLTCAGGGTRPVTLQGGTGLRARFGLDGADLVSDVREVARVLREQPPVPGLEIIDYIAPITDVATVRRLEDDLESLLAGFGTSGVTLAAPVEYQQIWDDAATFRVCIGSPSSAIYTPEPALDYVLRRARLQPDGKRVIALKRGEIEIFADRRACELLGRVAPYKCLEIAASIGSRRFCLLEGHWYEVDANYLETRRARVRDLFKPHPSLDLPAWDHGEHAKEADYNEAVPSRRPGYVCLDRKFIPNPLRSTGKIEICDLLAPDDTLVAVKHGATNESLSHLFWQGINAAQTLIGYAVARSEFAALVARHGRGRTISPDFTPKRIAFAILGTADRPVTAESLQPFALLALAEAADQLNGRGIEVEVISISPEEDNK